MVLSLTTAGSGVFCVSLKTRLREITFCSCNFLISRGKKSAIFLPMQMKLHCTLSIVVFEA